MKENLTLTTLISGSLLLLSFWWGQPIRAQTMTYEEAVQRIPERALPDFWVGDVAGLEDRFKSLTAGTLETIATSPGGRPLHLITYGQAEASEPKANFNSAVGGREPAAYIDKSKREKPVILLVGPVHGQEVEGLTGLVNLIQIMETGRDLRGRGQSSLRRLGQQCRLLIIPAGNPDGIARFEPRSLQSMAVNDLRFWGQGTWSDNTFCDWPEVKRLHPMRKEAVSFLGCYFNDNGINPMHDEFLDPMGPEAPAILQVAKKEGPDIAVSLHSHEPRPALLRPAYVTAEVQQEVLSLAARFYSLLKDRDLPHATPFQVQPEGGNRPAAFNLISAIYHISGADAFTFECPHGLRDPAACHVTLEEILDIQLTLYEAMMRHALQLKESSSALE